MKPAASVSNSLALLPVNLQVQRDFFAVVKRRHRLDRGFFAIQFRMHFVIDVRIQAAELVTAIRIRKAAAHGIGTQVLKEHDAVRKRRFRFVADDPAHRS